MNEADEYYTSQTKIRMEQYNLKQTIFHGFGEKFYLVTDPVLVIKKLLVLNFRKLFVKRTLEFLSLICL